MPFSNLLTLRGPLGVKGVPGSVRTGTLLGGLRDPEISLCLSEDVKNVSVASSGVPRVVRRVTVDGIGTISGVNTTPPHHPDGTRRSGLFQTDPEGRVVGTGVNS